jgi:outer membrane protein insertion porin family
LVVPEPRFAYDLRPLRNLASTHRLLRALALIVPLVALLLGPTRLAFAQPAGPEAAPQPAPPASAAPAPRPVAAGLDAAPRVAPTEAELVRGQAILDVEIVGNRRIASDDVRAYLSGARIGKAFTPEGIARDVRELWDSGFFDDVQVDLSRRDAGVRIRVIVREKPSIKAVEWAGNSEIDAEDLTEALSVEVKTGSVLSYAALRRGVQKIRDKYAEEGFFLAEATFEVLPERDNEVSVKFTVTEQQKVSVRRITFIGNHSIPDAELREVMITGQSSLLDFGSGGPFRQDAFERDVLVLSSLYYDRGFLGVQIATPRVMLTPDRKGIEITLAIQEGPRFKIRRLRVFEVDNDGREVAPIGGRRALRELVRAKPGDYFNRAELAKDLSSVQTMYRDHGYANVEARPDTQLYPEQREVDVVVTIRRRELVHFGRIEVRGNSKTRDKVIRREMEVKETELFTETGLEKSKRRISALGYFERVDMSTSQDPNDPGKVDVTFEVSEKPTGTFQVGAGFSSIENFIATAQVQQANLQGNGQSLALQAQISGLRQQIDLRLYEPYFLDSPYSAALSLYDQLRIYDQFSQSSLGGSLSFGYPIVDPELRASITYTLESDEVSTQTTSTFLGTASAVSTFQNLPLANVFNDGITSSVRPALTYDSRNNRITPSAGTYLQGSVELASTVFGSQNEFIRYRATGRYYYPITSSIVAKINAEAGLVESPTNEGVPIFARFFLGGILDVRGFPLRSIGPRLPLKRSLDENAAPILNGANIGGNLQYFQNVEIEFPILDQVGIRGVVFTDLGNVWNLEELYCDAAPSSPYSATNPCFSADSPFDVRTSWGFGIRWFSPLGPLRFEWGFPFSPLPYEESSVFEFTIGNFF